MATTVVTGVQYSGIWTMQQVNAAVAASTWPVPFVSLYGWGRNNSGQLGLSDVTNRSSPAQVGSGNAWKSTSIGFAASLAIKTDGTLWAWGSNSSGQLGLGNTTYYSSPKQVGTLTGWKQAVYSSIGSSIAIKTDGTLWAWGANNFGQLGFGNTTSRSSPVQVGALTNWSFISMGSGGNVVSVKTDGTLWTWGNNSRGQLGLNNTTYYSSPKQVGVLTTWLKVSAGSYFSSAITTSGALWSWGKNDFGQLGLGFSTVYSSGVSSPRQVGALTTWRTTSNGGDFVTANKSDGTLWSWGNGASGQLGLGNVTSYSSPKQIGALTTWENISTSESTSSGFAIKTDGTLWSWGANNFGQLGQGNTLALSSPTQIGSLASWLSISAGNYSALAIAS